MTAGLRSYGFSVSWKPAFGGFFVASESLMLKGAETLGEGWGLGQPSASVCPVETWVFPYN